MKRKWLAVGIVLLFVGTSVTQANARDDEKSQPASRGWLYVGGGGPGNYTRIQDAIDNASDGDTIFVYSGIYSAVVIYKRITLIGEDKTTTIINGSGFDRVIKVDHYTTGVTISGFTIQHGDTPKPSGWALGIDVASQIRIYDNIIRNAQYGIFINHRYTDILIYNNTICDTVYGIQAEFNDDSFLKIFYNTISNNTYGIYSYNNSEISIYENRITNNTIGIHVESQRTGNNTIYRNQIRDNEIGIEIEMCRAIKVEKNNFLKNEKHIALKKGTLVSTMVLLPVYRQRWNENYWDDWNKTTPRTIMGFIIFFIRILIPIKPFIVLVPIGVVPFFEFDRHPAQEPYDLPGRN